MTSQVVHDYATDVNQATEIASLASIDTKVTGVATAANQTTEITKLTSIDGKLNSLGQKTMANSAPVVLSSDQTLNLPSGASTSALQTTGNSSLSSIDGKLNSLGQKVATGSVPVVLASDQGALPLSSGAATSANQATEIASLASIDAGIPAALGATTMSASMPVVLPTDQDWAKGAKQDTGNTSLSSIDTKLTTTNSSLASIDAGVPAALGQTTKSASMPVVLPSDQDFATGANQTSEIAKLTSIDGKMNSLGQKTMANSMPVVIASDQNLLSTSALQTTGNSSLSSIDGKLNSLGQKTMANSTPVVLSSDQTLNLPSGASTSALQTTGNASLSSIDAGIPAALGSTTSANSMPVVLASDQVMNLPTGASTSANQTTEITSLQLIDDIPTAMNGAFSKGAPAMGQLDDTSTTAATEDNVAPVRITAQRAFHSNLRTNAGAEIGISGTPVYTRDVVLTVGQNRAQSVTTSAAEALGGATILANRTTLTILPTNGIIYWGYTSGVTVSSGTPIFKNQLLAFTGLTNAIHIYVIAASTVDARISES